MSLAEEQSGHHAIRYRCGNGFFARDGGQAILLQARELLLRKCGVQDDIRIEVERPIHRDLERVEVHVRPVQIDPWPEVCANCRDLFSKREGIARRGAFEQHGLREAGGAGTIRRVGRISAIHHQVEVDHRRRVALRQHDLQTAGERGLLHGRQAEGHRRSGRRLSGAVKPGFNRGQ